MKLYLLLIFVLLTSCNSNKFFVWERRKLGEGRLIFKVPKNGETIYFNNGESFEKDYIYNDSEILYISNALLNKNYQNMQDQGSFHRYDNAYYLLDTISLVSRNRNMGYISSDTLLLEGQDSLGLFWKNRFIQGFNIGYVRVSKNRKKIFDESVQSAELKIKHR